MTNQMTWHTVQIVDRQTGETLTTHEKAANQEYAELHVQDRLREDGDADRLSVVWTW